MDLNRLWKDRTAQVENSSGSHSKSTGPFTDGGRPVPLLGSNFDHDASSKLKVSKDLNPNGSDRTGSHRAAWDQHLVPVPPQGLEPRHGVLPLRAEFGVLIAFELFWQRFKVELGGGPNQIHPNKSAESVLEFANGLFFENYFTGGVGRGLGALIPVTIVFTVLRGGICSGRVRSPPTSSNSSSHLLACRAERDRAMNFWITIVSCFL